MKRVCSENILFTGAGFTKNFGGFLAKEMWSKIYNSSKIQNEPNIKKLLLKDPDYESIFHKIVNGKYSVNERNVLNEVILEAYQSLDKICREWRFTVSSANPVNIYGVNKLIALFCEDARKIGFFFTLNQDIFVERHFNSVPSRGLNTPGIQKIPDAHITTLKLPLEINNFVTLPNADRFEASNPESLHSCLHYVKLHGSFGWLSSNGLNRYVIGKDKENQIAEEPLLSWYFSLFQKVLSKPNRRLLVIGYGFQDSHVNEIFANSIKDFNLKLYVISPSSQQEFIEMLKSANYGETILEGLGGYFPYTLLDIFPSDQSESHAWEELMNCYFT